jgi:hypothetical protein
MKLREAIEKIDKSTKNETWVDFSEICQELNLEEGYISDESVFGSFECYWLKPWYCTDTWVGVSVVFLKNEPVAIRFQECRKCSTDYFWISLEARQNTLQECMRIIELLRNQDETDDFIDLNEEFDEFYSLEYNTQPLEKIGFYKGEQITFLGPQTNEYKEEGYFHGAKIMRESGQTEFVDVREIKFPIRIEGRPTC